MRSKRLGRVRAAISLVTVWSGESRTMKAVKRMAMSAPAASVKSVRRISRESTVASAKPRPTIGPIRGEMSIAPMTTAGEDSSNPSTAMPADMRIMKA